MEETIPGRRIFLVGENGEEKDGGSQCIEKSCRTKLMCCIDGIHSGIPTIKDKIIVISQQGEQAQQEDEGNHRTMLLHEAEESLDMNSKPAAKKENEEIVKDPIIQTIHQQHLPDRAIWKAIYIKIETGGKAGPIVKCNLQHKKNGQTAQIDSFDDGNPERHE